VLELRLLASLVVETFVEAANSVRGAGTVVAANRGAVEGSLCPLGALVSDRGAPRIGVVADILSKVSWIRLPKLAVLVDGGTVTLHHATRRH